MSATTTTGYVGETFNFIAIDGALNNFGIALGHVTRGKLIITGGKLISFNRRKRSIRLSDADRIRRIKKEIDHIISYHRPNIVFAEIPGGTQSAKAAWSLGVALAIIACLPLPIVFVTPTQVKKVVMDGASKKEMIMWATNLYPGIGWTLNKRKQIDASNEHVADACAVAHAAYQKYKYQRKADLT